MDHKKHIFPVSSGMVDIFGDEVFIFDEEGFDLPPYSEFTPIEEYRKTKMEQGGEVVPVFDFMKSDPKQQARAISVLEKRVSYQGKSMFMYEFIEGWESGLEIEVSKFNSRKSDKGYVEKITVGDHITDYKTESEYYKYLQGGGRKYSEFKEELNLYNEAQRKKANEEYDKLRALKDKAESEQRKQQDERLTNEIIAVLTKPKSEVIKPIEDSIKAKITELEKERKSSGRDEEIEYQKKNLQRFIDRIDTAYLRFPLQYKLVDSKLEKNEYNEGDEVYYIQEFGQGTKYIKTKIKEIKQKSIADGQPSYVVEKVDGIYNENIGYSLLLPSNPMEVKEQPQQIKKLPITDEVLKQAEVIGLEDYKKDVMRAPAQSKPLMDLTATLDKEMGDTRLYEAWIKGWEKGKDLEMREKFPEMYAPKQSTTKDLKNIKFKIKEFINLLNGKELMTDPHRVITVNPIFTKLPSREGEFVKTMVNEIKSGHKYTNPQIEKLANSIGITDKMVMKEMSELSIVIVARDLAHSHNLPTERERYDAIVDLYYNQVNLSYRTTESILRQQYSTPAPIGYIAGLYCGFNKEGLYFEPSAGNGLLTVAGKAENFIVNEIDGLRNRNLDVQGYKEVLDRDASDEFKGFDKKFDAIITNPPFGKAETKTVFEKFPIQTLEHIMAIRALYTMKDNGRAAIVIGGHLTYDDKGRVQEGKNRIFFNFLNHFYNVEDVININGQKLYSRQGTGFNTRIILINGRKETPQGAASLLESGLDAVDNMSEKEVSDFPTLFDRIINLL